MFKQIFILFCCLFVIIGLFSINFNKNNNFKNNEISLYVDELESEFPTDNGEYNLEKVLCDGLEQTGTFKDNKVQINNINISTSCQIYLTTKKEVYLYSLGNEFINLTGGWTGPYGYWYNPTNSGKKTNTSFSWTNTHNGSNQFFTLNTIDITSYKTLNIEYSGSYSYVHNTNLRTLVGVMKNKGYIVEHGNLDKFTNIEISKTGNYTGILSLDIGDLSGNYYITIGMGSCHSGEDTTGIITKVWFNN